MLPLFSVIIPTFQRNDLLAQCLDTLAPGKQTLAGGYYEVIVSDDGWQSTAQSMIEQHYPWVQWIKGPRKGPAANRNNGATHARGEWLLFLDDDCLPDPTIVEQYYHQISKNPDVQVFEGKIYTDRPKSRFDEEAPLNLSGGYMWSCNFCIRAKLFFSVGGFDEYFPYAAMEDVDLRLRLTKQTYEIRFCDQASVCHPWRIRTDTTHYRKHFESTLLFLRKHPEMKATINAGYYMKAILRDIYLNFIPNSFKFRFRGITILLRHYESDFRNSLYLLLNKKSV